MVSTNEEIINESVKTDTQTVPITDVKAISEEDFEKAQKTFQLGKKKFIFK